MNGARVGLPLTPDEDARIEAMTTAVYAGDLGRNPERDVRWLLRLLADLDDRLISNRKVLVDVLVYHWRTNTSGCGCGWGVLGASHAEHVADVYEQSVAARAGGEA